MTKRVFVVHGWDFNPNMNWYPSVKNSLESAGFEVKVLAMPDTSHPTIMEWVGKLAKEIDEVDEDTFFVGHSIGCLAILKFLESQVVDSEVAGGCVFVAPWFSLTDAATPDDNYKTIARPWLNLIDSLDFEGINARSLGFTCLFSDDDPYVPLSNLKLFEEKLGATVILLSGKSHFDEETAGVRELPEVVEKIKELNDSV